MSKSTKKRKQSRIRQLKKKSPSSKSELINETDEKDNNNGVQQCLVCYEYKNSIHHLPCCNNYVCDLCLFSYFKINMDNEKLFCISCDHILSKKEIIIYLKNNLDLIKKYKQRIGCPKCYSWQIKLEKKYLFFESNHSICQSCSYEWCKQCRSASHQNMSCYEYQQGDILIRNWAKQKDKHNGNQYNAHPCPKCGIYIQRTSGCQHIQCSQCRCSFCYNCGKRRRTIIFLGNHDNTLSPLG
ncbi:unnamed protein product [Didymodactylos carnosus]|uniref:RING-type domain-containing protein n=1 Tax=Didymodactylos carnosus TaxID=1234261 RepID=A0A814R201_9BILA|nr:unnamed protein product [Didymodactylos carnosus]CAF3890724.1 unnamed protein product [Didymodactylos carnosus]